MESFEGGPLITFALFTYNQERFIAEAIRGALSQTYSPLEIIISDDCSTDSTFEVIQKEIDGYTGQHTVRVNRNEHNIGFGAHINKVMEIVKGELIVAAAGDDVSLLHRVEKTYQAYLLSGGKAASLFSNAIIIDENGKHLGLYHVPPRAEELKPHFMAEHMSGVLGSSQAWGRRVNEVFGSIDERVWQEDLIIPFRAALIGEVRYINEPLVLYRRHSTNMYFRAAKDAAPKQLHVDLLNIADNRIAICENRLKDLETASQLFPARAAEFSQLRRTLLKMLQEMKNEKALRLETGTFKRMRIIGRAMLQNTSRKRVAAWVLTSFFPRFYVSLITYRKARLIKKHVAAKSDYSF
jgi:glycosyltransferase involved in cell wall biosynthesis